MNSWIITGNTLNGKILQADRRRLSSTTSATIRRPLVANLASQLWMLKTQAKHFCQTSWKMSFYFKCRKKMTEGDVCASTFYMARRTAETCRSATWILQWGTNILKTTYSTKYAKEISHWLRHKQPSLLSSSTCTREKMVIKYFIIFIHVHPSDCKKRRKMHSQCSCSACKNDPSVAVWNTKNTGGRKVEISHMHKYKSLQRCIETLSRRAVLYCRIWKLRDQHRYGLSALGAPTQKFCFAWGTLKGDFSCISELLFCNTENTTLTARPFVTENMREKQKWVAMLSWCSSTTCHHGKSLDGV